MLPSTRRGSREREEIVAEYREGGMARARCSLECGRWGWQGEVGLDAPMKVFMAAHRSAAVKLESLRTASLLAWHANYADSNLPTLASGIFSTRLLRQLLGLERFRQDEKFETLKFEEWMRHAEILKHLRSLLGDNNPA